MVAWLSEATNSKEFSALATSPWVADASLFNSTLSDEAMLLLYHLKMEYVQYGYPE